MGRGRGGSSRRRRGRGWGGPPTPSVARPDEPASRVAVGETGPSVARPAEPGPSGSSTSVTRPVEPVPSRSSTSVARPAKPGPPCSSSTWCSPPVQTTQQTDASYLSKVLCSTTLKESSITATSSPYPHPVAQGTTEGRCSPLVQTTQQRNASYLSNFLCSTTLKESSITATSLPYPHPVAQGTIEDPPLSRRHLSLGPPIFVLKPLFWYFKFYIRTGLSGSFHTYPDLGRPFKSLQEAENAIDCHLDDLRDPKMREESLDKLSAMERAIRLSLYWPDGTMKCRSEPLPIDKSGEPRRLMVQAFVDQYNEYHNLSGDLAYELEDVLRYQFFFSENERYIHVNFTTKTKGVDGFDRGIENLFFAEGKLIEGKYHQEMVVSCICIVEPNDNGHCYGCKSTRSIDMKHPNKADAYSGGHVNGYLPLGGFHTEQDDFHSLSIEAKERRLRRMFEGFDDPEFLRNINPIVSHQPE